MEKRNRYYDNSLDCVVCGKFFVASRVDAKYCSVQCRKLAKKQRDQHEKDFNKMREAIANYVTTYKRERQVLVTDLLDLKHDVDKLLVRFDY
jgi:hypothetical protein